MKSFLIRTFKFIICFIILLLVFNLLMILASSFSSDKIEKNVRKTSDILYEQGNHNVLSKRFDTPRDNYTDVIMVNYAYSIDSDDLLYSYMSGRKNYKAGQSKTFIIDTPTDGYSYANYSREPYDTTAEFKEFLDGEIIISANYARYWHGYLVLLRPLLLLFDITQIRSISFFVMLVSLIILSILIYKKVSKLFAFILPLGLVFGGCFSASIGLGSMPPFHIGIISSIIMLLRKEKIKSYALFFFIVGCITNFIDILSVPLVAWAIPTIVYIFSIMHDKEDQKISVLFWIKEFLKTLISFTTGYGLTWLSKWIIYDCLFHEGIIKNAIEQIKYRTYVESIYTHEDFKNGINYLTDLMFRYLGYTIPILGLIIFIFTKKYKVSLKKNFNIIPFILVGIIPFIWFRVLKNHTTIHLYITYRNLAITILCVLCAFIAPLKVTSKLKDKGDKKDELEENN